MIDKFMEKIAKQKELTEENFKEETMKFPKQMNGLTGGAIGSMVGIPAGGALFYKTNKVAPAVLAPVGAALAGNLIGRSLPVSKKYRQAVDAMTPEEIKEQIEWTNKIHKGYTPTEDEQNYMPPLARHLYNQEKAATETINEGLYKIALTRGAKELYKAQNKLRKITADGTKNLYSPEAEKLMKYMDKVNPYEVDSLAGKKIPPRYGFGKPVSDYYGKIYKKVENEYMPGAHKDSPRTLKSLEDSIERNKNFDLMQNKLRQQKKRNNITAYNYL